MKIILISLVSFLASISYAESFKDYEISGVCNGWSTNPTPDELQSIVDNCTLYEIRRCQNMTNVYDMDFQIDKFRIFLDTGHFGPEPGNVLIKGKCKGVKRN